MFKEIDMSRIDFDAEALLGLDWNRLGVTLFRLGYGMVIMLLLCFLDQEENLAGQYAYQQYYMTTREIAQNRLVLAKMRAMNERKMEIQGEIVLENAVPEQNALHYAMQDYQVASQWIRWPVLEEANATPMLQKAEKVVATAGRPCTLVTRQEWKSGIKLTDVLCDGPIILGPVRYISEEFYLPQGLEYQYRFWFVVYALMSAQNYAIHSRVHPGVIFEIVDAEATAVSLYSPGIEGARAIGSRVAYYTDLLHKMQTLANHRRAFTQPDMQRVEKAMNHIHEKNKYARAADEIRVQRGQREFLQKGLADAALYMPWIHKEFDAAGLPRDLANLAFVESSFNIDALSKAGASGVFQIMPYVGRGYDMLVNEAIDERNDPVKSARAAAQILKDYYDRTGSWPLAVTAYNHGITSMLSAMKKLDTSDLGTIVANYEKASFGFASKNYYTCFLAMLAVVHDRDIYFPDVDSSYPINFETVTLTRQTTIDELLDTYKFDREHLLFLNPDINVDFLAKHDALPANYEIKVPPHRLLQLVMKNSQEEKH